VKEGERKRGQSVGVISGCEFPIIACRSWCEGMETVVEKRGGTGRKRMTGAAPSAIIGYKYIRKERKKCDVRFGRERRDARFGGEA
jgi:hypothetical protein